LKLHDDKLLSNFAFNFSLRRYIKVLSQHLTLRVRSRTNVLAYFDNWQDKNRKTARVRLGGKVSVPVKCAVEIFHLIRETHGSGATAANTGAAAAAAAVAAETIAPPLLEQYTSSLHPSAWPSPNELRADFHTDDVGNRKAIAAGHARRRWQDALEHSKALCAHPVGGDAVDGRTGAPRVAIDSIELPAIDGVGGSAGTGPTGGAVGGGVGGRGGEHGLRRCRARAV
jgi:hypothetical protein